MAEIHSSEHFFGSKKHAVYDVLSQIEPGLMLDIGAAAGHFTRLMLSKSPDSQVYAFEPFPGNHRFFNETLGGDQRVKLLPVAASDSLGAMHFHVGSTVGGEESGWEKMKGYSSVGMLVELDEPKEGLIEVETTTVDLCVGSRNVRFMKIDVQGGEYRVLKGSEKAIDNQQIDIIFIEYSGEKDVLNFLLDKDYKVYDSDYLLIPSQASVDLTGWSIFEELPLSTGRTAYCAWPLSRPQDSDMYRNFFQGERDRIGGLQTDLVAVSPHFTPIYERCLASLIA